MATAEQCAAAFQQLADRLASADASTRDKASFDRTLSCTLADLKLTFAGRLRDGELLDIRQVQDPTAQIRLVMSSDDLIELVDGRLNMLSAWANGRVKIDAGVMDLLRLRSVF